MDSVVTGRDASDCNGQASDRLQNCSIQRLHMQPKLVQYLKSK